MKEQCKFLETNKQWNKKGYNRVYSPRSQNNVSAHRAAWEEVNGPVPTGLFVLHKCDTPACVNPNHLFVGTHRDNMQDMVSKGRHAEQKKTHCPKGHPYSGDNLVIKSDGSRRCRECHRASAERRRNVG